MEDGSFGTRETSETTESLSPLRLSPPYSLTSTCSAKEHGSSIVNGFQKDSRAEKELLQQDHGGWGVIDVHKIALRILLIASGFGVFLATT